MINEWFASLKFLKIHNYIRFKMALFINLSHACLQFPKSIVSSSQQYIKTIWIDSPEKYILSYTHKSRDPCKWFFS